MLEKLKNLLWVVFGGLAIGTVVRRGYDSLRGIPTFYDAPLVEIESILLGGGFIVLWILVILTVLAMMEHRPWQEAKEHWDRNFPDKINKPNYFWLIFRWQNTILSYISIYIFLGYSLCTTLAGGFNRDGIYLFTGWCFLICLNWLFLKGRAAGKVAKEPDTLEANITKMFDLPDIHGPIIIISIIVALVGASSQYYRISQTFGGGKPERVLIFLKKDQVARLPSLENVDGKIVDLVFRKGTKIGLKANSFSDRHIIVIDQDKIDRMYIGKGILELDPSKLK